MVQKDGLLFLNPGKILVFSRSNIYPGILYARQKRMFVPTKTQTLWPGQPMTTPYWPILLCFECVRCVLWKIQVEQTKFFCVSVHTFSVVLWVGVGFVVMVHGRATRHICRVNKHMNLSDVHMQNAQYANIDLHYALREENQCK